MNGTVDALVGRRRRDVGRRVVRVVGLQARLRRVGRTCRGRSTSRARCTARRRAVSWHCVGPHLRAGEDRPAVGVVGDDGAPGGPRGRWRGRRCGPGPRPVTSPRNPPSARTANRRVTSRPPTVTSTEPGRTPRGSRTATSASPPETRSARLESTSTVERLQPASPRLGRRVPPPSGRHQRRRAARASRTRARSGSPCRRRTGTSTSAAWQRVTPAHPHVAERAELPGRAGCAHALRRRRPRVGGAQAHRPRRPRRRRPPGARVGAPTTDEAIVAALAPYVDGRLPGRHRRPAGRPQRDRQPARRGGAQPGLRPLRRRRAPVQHPQAGVRRPSPAAPGWPRCSAST